MFVCVGRWQRSNVACQADKEKAKIRAIEQISADITFVVYTAKVFFDRNKTSNCCVYSNSFEASRQNSVVFHSTHCSLLLLFIFLPFFFLDIWLIAIIKSSSKTEGEKNLNCFLVDVNKWLQIGCRSGCWFYPGVAISCRATHSGHSCWPRMSD